MQRGTKRKLAITAAVVVVVLIAGGVAFWWQFFRDDAPAPVALSTAGSTTTAAPGTTAAGEEAPSADGDWRVAAGESFAGYRVTETFAGFSAPSDAVGRSTAVEGTLTVDGASVPAAEFEVDMTRLESDSTQRDGALRSRGLEIDRFPTASFRLTGPVDLGGDPAQGTPVTATATGELTLHGVTRPVEVPIEAVWTGDGIEVVGSVEVDMTDYGMEPPTTGRVVSIEEVGTVEFQLFFEPA